MKIGDRVFVPGYVDEIRKDTVIIRNKGGYFGTDPSEVICGEPKTGRWAERIEDADGVYEICSVCGADTDITHYGESYAYCPNCGAKMESGDAE